MLSFIKRLNWFGFTVMAILSLISSLSRKQDPDIITSLKVWLIIGLPVSIIFLIIGIKPKNS